jgi:hypothetical protein
MIFFINNCFKKKQLLSSSLSGYIISEVMRKQMYVKFKMFVFDETQTNGRG